MKLRLMLRRLLIRSLVLLAILGLIGGLILCVMDLDDQYTKQAQELQLQTDGIVREINTLRDQFTKVGKSEALYKEIQQKMQDHSLTVGRIAMRDAFSAMRSKYYFGDIKINILQDKPLEDAKYKRPTAVVESAGVTLDMQTSSDEYIYQMINDITQKFPGIKISHLDLILANPLTATALQEIIEKGGAQLIKVNMKFTWFGLHPLEDPAAATDGAPAPATPATVPGA